MTQLIADLVARLGQPARKSSASVWVYSTSRGIATLNRGDELPLKKLGNYASESLARKACEEHFKKATRGLENLGKQLPEVQFA